MASIPHQNPTDQSDLTALKGRIPLLGLTGGIGSGKTAVSDLLGQLAIWLLYYMYNIKYMYLFRVYLWH